jgi:hypothetical protein
MFEKIWTPESKGGSCSEHVSAIRSGSSFLSFRRQSGLTSAARSSLSQLATRTGSLTDREAVRGWFRVAFPLQ